MKGPKIRDEVVRPDALDLYTVTGTEGMMTEKDGDVDSQGGDMMSLSEWEEALSEEMMEVEQYLDEMRGRLGG